MWFEYHCWEDEASTDAQLWHHTHQWVDVVNEYIEADDVEVFNVSFSDGFTSDVFIDELLLSPTQYTRPNWVPTP